MNQAKSDLLHGTLDMRILKTLALEPAHASAIAQRIQQLSREAPEVNQRSLYPARSRLEHQGWIAAEWGTSENNRKAKFYSLTQEGRRQLDAETENWERVSAAIDRVLETA